MCVENKKEQLCAHYLALEREYYQYLTSPVIHLSPALFSFLFLIHIVILHV